MAYFIPPSENLTSVRNCRDLSLYRLTERGVNVSVLVTKTDKERAVVSRKLQCYTVR